MNKPKTGTIVWHDLTIDNADKVRDFYSKVAGWKADPVEMGGYSDYSMLDPDGQGTAGICWRRGPNANLPPQWLIYITVEDVQKSADAALQSGGKVIEGPRKMGGQDFCVLQDPAGAYIALISG
jgi:uncharacterized protein